MLFQCYKATVYRLLLCGIIDNSKSNLSRRVVIFEVEGLSFKEFSELKNSITLPVLSLEDILSNHIDIAYKLLDKVKFNQFKEYLRFFIPCLLRLIFNYFNLLKLNIL